MCLHDFVLKYIFAEKTVALYDFAGNVTADQYNFAGNAIV